MTHYGNHAYRSNTLVSQQQAQKLLCVAFYVTNLGEPGSVRINERARVERVRSKANGNMKARQGLARKERNKQLATHS